MKVNWRQFVIGLSDPNLAGGLTSTEVATFQARYVTPPPTTRPAMLIRRATAGLRKGVIGAQALGKLVGTEAEQVLADFANDTDIQHDLDLIDTPAYGPFSDEDDVERFAGRPF